MIQQAHTDVCTAQILILAQDGATGELLKPLLSQQYEVQVLAETIMPRLRQLPTLLIVDVAHAKSNGFDWLRAIRANPQTQDLPIILLASEAEEEDLFVGLEAGANDYIIKPFSARELLVRISANLKIAQLRQQAVYRTQKPEPIKETNQNLNTLKQLEATLRQTEANYQRLVAHLPAMVYRYFPCQTGTDAFTYASSGSRELFELEPQTIIADANSFLKLIHPEDLLSFQESVAAAVRDTLPWQWEGRITTPSGKRKWIQGISRAERTADGNTVWDGLLIDISDRKQAEEALRESEEFSRSIFESSADCVKVLALDGCLVSMNKTGQCLMEIDDCNALVGQYWPDFWPEQSRNAVITAIASALGGGIGHFSGYCPTAKGTLKWWDVIVTPILDAQGKPKRLLSISRDLTKLKQAEIERAQLLERERETNRVKDEFLAVLSHELRSPLNPILGWSRLLQTRKFDEFKVAEVLKTIERNAQLQAKLIEDLLDVSRVLTGKLTLNISTVDLVAVIEAALETMNLAAVAKSIQIQKIFNTEHRKGNSLPQFQVSGDADRLQQVVLNLLANAIKFTTTGGRVEVRLSVVEGAGDVGEWGSREVGEKSQQLAVNSQQSTIQNPKSRIQNSYAQIQVIDTGRGISAKFLPHVFEYFRQADGSTTRKYGGLGLGLAIVRHLVELHGGIVTADSPGEGKGATFSVLLPLLNLEPEAEIESESINSLPDLTGVRVLVVEDTDDSRHFLVFVLEQAGAIATAVASVAEALSALEQCQPDVIISDIGIPEEDGYSLIRKVRALAPEQGGKIPAIALSAYAGECDRHQAFLAGFQQHLPKPIEPDELVAIVANLVGQYMGINKEI